MAKFDVDSDLVRKLASLINETGLTELEYSEGEKRIRLQRGGVVSAAPVQQFAAAPVAAAPAAVAAAPVDAVTSPMVGTAYLSATPGAKPFAPVGGKVKAGDTILIIEAMKVMNPIKAPKGGTITQVLVNDAQPVEFGQPLLVIE
ncbi:MAG: acetyl-CoA carboxylase biotin carboxyl carrier protein [Alphaproteobacteria bacterium]|nr:acetyl-CoA carboxylase biotin carboxyl carrier protein [Alphaproteobacteria bacterium]